MTKLFKKKGFLIDKITEDSFYENLLLGLPSLLKKCQFVTQTRLKRYPPATLQELSEWETANSLKLPEDLRNFFLSTNGFSFSYTFQYDKSENEEVNSVVCSIDINPLSKFEKLQTVDTTYLTDGGVKVIAPNSKIHVLANLDDNVCIVLAQFNPVLPPTIWLYYKRKIFYFLCEDVSTYFRIALAYVGVPGWQLSVLSANLPEWSADMLQILAPGIFNNRQLLFETKSEVNKIDSGIFDLELNSGRHEEKKESLSKRKPSPRYKPKK